MSHLTCGVQECCAKVWDRVWFWAMLQKSRVQELAVFFADDSKRNVDVSAGEEESALLQLWSRDSVFGDGGDNRSIPCY